MRVFVGPNICVHGNCHVLPGSRWAHLSETETWDPFPQPHFAFQFVGNVWKAQRLQDLPNDHFIETQVFLVSLTQEVKTDQQLLGSQKQDPPSKGEQGRAGERWEACDQREEQSAPASGLVQA